MKKLFKAIKSKNFKTLFLDPTDSASLQFFRYLFAGGGATVVDWVILFVLYDILTVELYLAVAAAFGVGIVVNYWLSNLFVFHGAVHYASKTTEFAIYVLSGLIGLGFTEIFMFLFCEKLSLHYIISKVITTLLVLIWNFGSKKLILYRKKDK